MTRLVILIAAAASAIAGAGGGASAQTVGRSSPAQNVDEITDEAQTTPAAPALTIDRPLYRALQESKRELSDKFGINWAIEDTLIYQGTSAGIRPRDALVNTLGLFATWKIFRSDDGKDFGGVAIQIETRGNPLDRQFTDLVADLGTIWSPNDSTSDDYTKINQLWWGQRFAEGRGGLIVGKIDPGAHINGNRFAGSGNTQFFGQPYATNPARSFPDNGLGAILRAEPADWIYGHLVVSDGTAVSTHSPFTTLDGNWFYAAEVGLKPNLPRLGAGNYRFMAYYREAESADEVGWSFSGDQNLTSQFGAFLRYGGNDGGINGIEHLVSGGLSLLAPFGRPNDQAGVGVSWTRPADDALRDQYAAEVYYRLQLTEGLEVSASAQLIVDPSAGDEDAVGVYGLRARLLY